MKGGYGASIAWLDHVDKKPNPEVCNGDIEENHEGQGSFVVACYDAAHLIEPVEYPLDAVAVPIAFPVCLLRSAMVFA